MQASSKQQLLFSSQIIKTSFNSFIENVERDIQFLSNNPLLELYLNTETNPKDKEKYNIRHRNKKGIRGTKVF